MIYDFKFYIINYSNIIIVMHLLYFFNLKWFSSLFAETSIFEILINIIIIIEI